MFLFHKVKDSPGGFDHASEFTDELLESVQNAMGALGSVVLVRFVENKVWFTFADSRMALKAAESGPLKVCES